MTQSLEDYLETVHILISEQGSACVRDVAKLLDVKMPSVVKAVHELKRLGLVTQEPYALLHQGPLSGSGAHALPGLPRRDSGLRRRFSTDTRF